MSDSKQHLGPGRRQILSGLVGAGAAGAVLLAAYSTRGSTGASLESAKPVADGIVYLTFDDGPTPGYTNEVLTHLKVAGARATFFQVGERMVGNAALVKQILADGHQIGTHSWNHPDFTQLAQPNGTMKQFGVDTQQQILRPRSIQVSYTEGYDSGLFRYPHFHRTNYGDLVLKEHAMIPMYADVAPLDFDLNVTDSDIINEIVAHVHDGAVVDLHDGSGAHPMLRPAPSYLPQLLAVLRKAGYSFGTLDANDLPAAAIKVTKQPE